MTPEERQLIADLFDRMRSTDLHEKDREAESMINQAARSTPDAVYKMVQSVLILEHTLNEANYRIEELEARVQELENYGRPQQQPQQSSGGFLGGLFGGGARPAPQSQQGYRGAQSVPSAGQYAPRTASPWSQQAPMPPQGNYGQPAAQPGPYAQPQSPPQRTGGGFMRTAAMTAAGVAGGVLAANAISSMLGGNNAGNAQANQTPPQTSSEPSPYEVTQNDDSSGWQSSDASDSGWDSGGGDADI